MAERSIPRIAAAAVTLLSLLLSACLLMPGKFTSDLDVRKDGRFTFHYAGEILFLPLSKLANADKDAAKTFEPAPCQGDDGGSERPCTAEEIASQRQDWQREQQEQAERKKREAEQAKAFMGGIDPADPRSGEEFAARLRRQTGWRKVDYKGDGLFDVDYAISGRLDHDFSFPTIERLPMADAFVQVVLHQDGTVRVDTPGFNTGAITGSPLQAMMMGMAAAGAAGGDAASGKASGMPAVPTIDGRFTIRTDAEILANNTDQGPRDDPAGKRLDWTVDARGVAPPTALLRLAR